MIVKEALLQAIEKELEAAYKRDIAPYELTIGLDQLLDYKEITEYKKEEKRYWVRLQNSKKH